MNKGVFRSILTLFIISIVSILFNESAGSNEPDIDYIIGKVKAQQSKHQEEIRDTVFLAESTYKEKKKNDEVKKVVVTRKRVYTKGSEKHYEQYLSMSVNGKQLTKEAMEAEVRKQNKPAKDGEEKKGARETIMPLTPEGEGAYDFRLIGSKDWNGLDVWLVGFEAQKKEDGYVNGTSYISKSTFDVVYLEFTPAKLSRVVKDMKFSFDYSLIQGYYMPVKFQMNLKLKMGFLFHKHIEIVEVYSKYKFNSQLRDSIFEPEF